MSTYTKKATTWASPAGMALAWTRAHISRAIRRVRYKLGIIDRYVVRSRHEWAVIYIDEELGSFQCQSTYGNYAYIWRSIGSDTLKEFLRDLDFDYFMKKARPNYRQFDADKTINGLRDMILESRRYGGVDRTAAREAWLALDEIESRDANDFINDVSNSTPLADFLHNDFSDIARESPDSDSRQFWTVIWPAFLEQIGGRRK